MLKIKDYFDASRKDLKKMTKQVKEIEDLAREYELMTDEQLQGQTAIFKERLKKGESVDDILIPAFATVREASKRVLGLYPYPVQLIGGMVIHGGNIAEMKTGEGKSLTATLPTYLNALLGKGVHIITVNEYLSERDSIELGELYNWLGLSVGLNKQGLSASEKRMAYEQDITFTTNSELGFDYLRDNMVKDVSDKVQRGLDFAVIDEVDSILIDEARTPLIISGIAGTSTMMYKKIDNLIKRLNPDDYIVDIKSNTVSLTEDGINKVEDLLSLSNLYDPNNSKLLHYVDNALKANYTMLRDKDYVVVDDKVQIVDHNTGRIMEGRRFSDGVHQSLEAKEGVTIQNETNTVANITYQNLFRLYSKLSGMTGTAKTEEEEFREIYNMNVVPIPTNKPVIRTDNIDIIYPTLNAKYRAIVKDIHEKYEKGQPILVGTGSVEISELISSMLVTENIPHEVLNAKNHKRESEIIAKAGEQKSVTIATNMAGRGTDIKLGYGVKELGGLAVIGTERADSRRVDNQLRGRAGRQGDVGESQFYLSLEDELLLRFGGDKLAMIMQRFRLAEDDIVLKNKTIMKQVESAQKRVEGNNYDMRKTILDYDDVMNGQRKVIYKQRDEILESDNLHEITLGMMERSVERLVLNHLDGKREQWKLQELCELLEKTGMLLSAEVDETLNALTVKDDVVQYFNQKIVKTFDENSKALNPDNLARTERAAILNVVDSHWMAHIEEDAQFKQGIQLRSYAQDDPRVAYQTESYASFEEMIRKIEDSVTKTMWHTQQISSVPSKETEDNMERMFIK